MTSYQMQFLNELAAGHDGPPIPAAKLAYFQERLRGRIFEFILKKFLAEQENGLTQAKLARRIGKKPDVINRWLGAPSNLQEDTISDLLIGICAEELNLSSSPVLARLPVNFSHLDESASAETASRSALQQPPSKGGALARAENYVRRTNLPALEEIEPLPGAR